MEEIIKMVMSYGALGACLAYFIYKDIDHTKCAREDREKGREEFKEVVGDFRDILQEIRDMLLVKGAA